MIGRRAIDARPECIPCAGSGGANVGVAVVPVDAPGVRNPLMIEQLMARPADVIHDLVASIFFQRFTHPCRDVVENFIPAHSFPFSFSPLSHPFQGITNALGVGDLIECRRPFGTVASAAAGMLGIAFKSSDAHRFLVDETEETARRLAVKTDRRNNLITLLDFSG